MVQQCAVPGCGNVHGCKKNLRIHKFPWHNEALVNEWLKAIRRKCWYPSKNSAICSDHFMENDYISSFSHRLKPNIIPSRLLPVAKKCLLCQHEGNDECCNKVKMSVNCSVRGCISIKEDGNGINFFRFPTKPQQREQWLKILNIPSLDSPINSYVCSKHFEQKYFVTNNGNQILLPGAVPIPTKKSNSTYTKNTNTCNLVSIRPKPSPIFTTNQNILIKPLPIVVVPLQNNNSTIPTNTINLNLKTQVNQNFSKLQTFQTHLVKINDQIENNGLPAIPISEKIVEINNCDAEEKIEEENNIDNDSEETESAESDTETTQNSTKQDESCYVLVEVNDKIDDSLNPQNDANIVASGFNIKELINDAKIAINNRFRNIPTSTPNFRSARGWRTNYVGDCVFEDMEDPEIRKHHWTLALNEIQKLRNKVKGLEQKTRRLQKRLNSAKLNIIQLKQNKNDNSDDADDDDDNNVQIELDDE